MGTSLVFYFEIIIDNVCIIVLYRKLYIVLVIYDKFKVKTSDVPIVRF